METVFSPLVTRSGKNYPRLKKTKQRSSNNVVKKPNKTKKTDEAKPIFSNFCYQSSRYFLRQGKQRLALVSHPENPYACTSFEPLSKKEYEMILEEAAIACVGETIETNIGFGDEQREYVHLGRIMVSCYTSIDDLNRTLPKCQDNIIMELQKRNSVEVRYYRDPEAFPFFF